MTFPDWGRLLQAFVKAAHDFKANTPRPAATEMSGAEMAAALREIEAQLPAIIAAIDAQPGAITAADDILSALFAAGFTWAGPMERLVDGSPGALRIAKDWLPKVLWALETFNAAPTQMSGPGPYRGR